MISEAYTMLWVPHRPEYLTNTGCPVLWFDCLNGNRTTGMCGQQQISPTFCFVWELLPLPYVRNHNPENLRIIVETHRRVPFIPYYASFRWWICFLTRDNLLMRGGHGVLTLAVILSALIQETYSACIPSTLKLFQNFSNSAVSAQGQLPPAGSCITWPITIVDGASSCSEPNGTMLFELWVTDSNWNVIDPQRTVSGLYFMAAQTPPAVSYGYARLCAWCIDVSMACWYCIVYTDYHLAHAYWIPQVTTSGSSVSFSPTLPPTSASPANQFNYLYLDSASTSDLKPTYRFTIPVGLLFDLVNLDSQTWHLSLANMNMQPPSDVQYYTIRSTCMLSDQVRFGTGDGENRIKIPTFIAGTLKQKTATVLM